MLHQIAAVARKDLLVFLKDPGSVVVTFVMPMMFVVVMSFALSGAFRSDDEGPIRVLVVNADRGDLAAPVIRDLGAMEAFATEPTWRGERLSRALAERLVASGQRAMALYFPPGFSEALRQDPGDRRIEARVLCIVDPAASAQFVEPVIGTLQGLVERAAYLAATPSGIDYLFDTIAPAAPASQRQAFKRQAHQALTAGLVGGDEPAVTVERATPAGATLERLPDTFQQNVPGYTLFGIFWIVSLLASSVLKERREGTFRRLLAAPISRPTLLAGKVAPYYVINVLQIATMLGTARLFFGMSLGGSPAGLVAVSLAAAATATSLGVLVAAIARTEAQVGGLTTLLLLTLSALGGCFVPRYVMPDWLRTAGLATPHAWALEAYQDLLVRGYGVAEVFPKVAVLLVFAAVLFGVGVARFRFE